MLVTIVGRFRHVRRAVRAQVRAAVAVAASAPGLARAAGSDLDPRSGARVVLEQPGGCRGHLKRQYTASLPSPVCFLSFFWHAASITRRAMSRGTSIHVRTASGIQTKNSHAPLATPPTPRDPWASKGRSQGAVLSSCYHETHYCAASKHRARVRPWKRCAPAYSNAGALVAALRLVAALVKAAAKRVFVCEQSFLEAATVVLPPARKCREPPVV